MSIIKRVQPIPQPRRRGEVDNAEAKQRKKLTLAEGGIIASFGVSGLVGLFLLAWLALPHSSNILPFMVASALPLFTLFAIIYQAVVYRRQWSVMQQSLAKTDKVIEKMQAQLHQSDKQILLGETQMRIAGEAMKISRQGVENAERSSINAQRAYVTITKREMVEHGFYLTIENSGNTPALDVGVRVTTNVGFTPQELPKEITLKGSTHIGLLAPHAGYEMLVPFEGSVSESDREYFDDPEWQFDWWCTGTIMYYDIFQTPHVEYHETNFCFYQDRPRMKVQAWVSGNDMKVHRTSYPNYPEKIPDPN